MGIIKDIFKEIREGQLKAEDDYKKKRELEERVEKAMDDIAERAQREYEFYLSKADEAFDKGDLETAKFYEDRAKRKFDVITRQLKYYSKKHDE